MMPTRTWATKPVAIASATGPGADQHHSCVDQRPFERNARGFESWTDRWSNRQSLRSGNALEIRFALGHFFPARLPPGCSTSSNIIGAAPRPSLISSINRVKRSAKRRRTVRARSARRGRPDAAGARGGGWHREFADCRSRAMLRLPNVVRLRPVAKTYDRAYFDRWYRGRAQIGPEPEVLRKVAMAIAV